MSKIKIDTIVSATLKSVSLMPDGKIVPVYTNIVFGEPDSQGDVYVTGCFDESIKKSKCNFFLHIHNDNTEK